MTDEYVKVQTINELVTRLSKVEAILGLTICISGCFVGLYFWVRLTSHPEDSDE